MVLYFATHCGQRELMCSHDYTIVCPSSQQLAKLRNILWYTPVSVFKSFSPNSSSAWNFPLLTSSAGRCTKVVAVPTPPRCSRRSPPVRCHPISLLLQPRQAANRDLCASRGVWKRRVRWIRTRWCARSGASSTRTTATTNSARDSSCSVSMAIHAPTHWSSGRWKSANCRDSRSTESASRGSRELRSDSRTSRRRSPTSFSFRRGWRVEFQQLAKSSLRIATLRRTYNTLSYQIYYRCWSLYRCNLCLCRMRWICFLWAALRDVSVEFLCFFKVVTTTVFAVGRSFLYTIV